jgi:hypothetical protein
MMPVEPYYLYQYCEKEVVILPGSAPLYAAFQALEEAGYFEASAWLIVEMADGSYRASLFADLLPLIEEEGPEVFYTLLDELPIPPVSRVVPTNTPESGQEILDWLHQHPGATVIIVEGERCAGLFTNPGAVAKGLGAPPVLETFHAFQRSTRLESMIADDSLESFTPEITDTKAVELHTDIDFPHHVRPGEEKPLVVRLSPEAPTDTRVESTVTIEMADPFVPEPVEVLVHAPGFRERQDRWKQTIQVYSFTASTPAVFLLSAGTEEGVHTIGLDFRHKDRLVSSTRFDVVVAQEPPTQVDAVDQPSPRLAPVAGDAEDPDEQPPVPVIVISANPPDAADVELRVHLSADNRLSYELHSRLPAVGYQNAPMGEVKLASDPSRFLRSTFAELSMLAQNHNTQDADKVIQQIEAIGENLYLDLFPDKLQEAYWKLVALRKQGRIRSLLITSDEPWIPWELINPYNEETDEADDFLAGSWQLCRWLAGGSPVDRVKVMAARLIAPNLDLEFVEQERLCFEEMKSWGVDIGPGPLQQLEEVQELKRQGQVELLHFATHGNFDANNPDEAVIRLANRAVLSPRDLRGRRVSGLRQARPIIFLNACHTAQMGFTLTGLGGWAERMVIDVRASAFIGTLWEVNDELAAEFSHRFYQALWQKATLGEAFYTARQHVRNLQPANSTWLAYTLYGDPNIPVLWG